MNHPLLKAVLIVLALIGAVALIGALAMSIGCCGTMGSGMMGSGMMGGGMLTMLLAIAAVVAIVAGVVVFIFRKVSGPR